MLGWYKIEFDAVEDLGLTAMNGLCWDALLQSFLVMVTGVDDGLASSRRRNISG